MVRKGYATTLDTRYTSTVYVCPPPRHLVAELVAFFINGTYDMKIPYAIDKVNLKRMILSEKHFAGIRVNYVFL